ncbi:MAG: hypothetical protein IPH37_19470 [Burkholderiales bacterium]|nr:hypothetical protein [Burkholderiales bacterium]
MPRGRRKKDLKLVVDLPGRLSHHGQGDPGRIRQVLNNLCDNAIKFTSQGDITIRAQASAQGGGDHCMVTLSVSRHGYWHPQRQAGANF